MTHLKLCRTLEINLLTAKHEGWPLEQLLKTIPQTDAALLND